MNLDIEDDYNKSWGVYFERYGWYWYDADGCARGPYDTEDMAEDYLDAYERGYYEDYDING